MDIILGNARMNCYTKSTLCVGLQYHHYHHYRSARTVSWAMIQPVSATSPVESMPSLLAPPKRLAHIKMTCSASYAAHVAFVIFFVVFFVVVVVFWVSHTKIFFGKNVKGVANRDFLKFRGGGASVVHWLCS